MGKFKDITGHKFNRLTVVGLDIERSNSKRKYWLCQCDCGNPTLVSARSCNLQTSTKSCGCLNRELGLQKGKKSLHNLTTLKFGKLTVVTRVERKNSRNAYWLCECECGRENVVRGSHLESNTITSCYNCARGGINHPLYDNTITDEERKQKRNYPEYYHWRKSVYERDNYTCRCCGKNGDVNAHHILNYSEHRDLRTDIDNGITLCGDCHMRFHTMYGRRENNHEQLEEFLSNEYCVNG